MVVMGRFSGRSEQGCIRRTSVWSVHPWPAAVVGALYAVRELGQCQPNLCHDALRLPLLPASLGAQGGLLFLTSMDITVGCAVAN